MPRLSDAEVIALAYAEDSAELEPALRTVTDADLAAEMRRKVAAERFERPFDIVTHIEPDTLNPPHLQLIDEHLAACREGGIRRLHISMPPQEGKTSRVAQAGSLYFLLHNPELRIVLASYELELARNSSQWVRDAIESHGSTAAAHGNPDLLGLSIRPDYRAASRWRLRAHRGGMYAVGTKGGLTGRPADVLIIDDGIKGIQEADSLSNREAVWAWWTGTARTRLGPNSIVILIGTRWHEDDLSGRLIAADAALPPELREWVVLNLPAISEFPDPERGIPPDALGREPGVALPSTRGRDLAEYRRIELGVGPRVWNALFQGHPSPPEGGAFKWAWIRGFRLAACPPLVKVTVAVDPSGGGQRDETGIIVAGRDATGRMLVTDDRSGVFGAGEQWRRVWLTCLDVEADTLVYEKNLVDPIMRKGIRAAWRSLRREARALLTAQATLTAAGGPADPAAVVSLAVETMLANPTVVLDDDDELLADEILVADDQQTEARKLLTARLSETLLYADRVVASPATGPAAVVGVSATRGKRIRAEPAVQAYSTGRVIHVGTFPALESQLTSWQEGQDSPDRMDALVWAYWHLSGGAGVVIEPPPPAVMPTGTDAAIPRPSNAPQIPTGSAAVTRGR